MVRYANTINGWYSVKLNIQGGKIITNVFLIDIYYQGIKSFYFVLSKIIKQTTA